MKKSLSLILLAVFLFNVGGYYLVYLGMHLHVNLQRSNQQNVDHYNSDEAVEVKIPFALPYPVRTDDDEHLNGRFRHNGVYYKLVKQKYQHDTLFVVLLRDVEMQELDKSISHYVHLTQGIPGTSPLQKALQVLGKLALDFFSADPLDIAHPNGLAILISFPNKKNDVAEPHLRIDAPPPRG